MRVGQQDMGGALGGGAVLILGQHRVAVEPGIEEQNLFTDFDPERAVAEPCDVHWCLRLGFMLPIP